MFNSDLFDGLLRIADDAGIDLTVYPEYAEPGYSRDGDGPIVSANWNNQYDYNRETGERTLRDDRPERLAAAFERIGCTIEWCDEWIDCYDCGNCFRSTGDSYGWTMYGYVYDGHCSCGDCIKDDPEPYLDELEGCDRRAIAIDGINPADHGYREVGTDYENGFHHGQTDDPAEIAKALRRMEIDRFVFTIDSVGQFDLSFSVHVHESEWSERLADRLRGILETGDDAGESDESDESE